MTCFSMPAIRAYLGGSFDPVHQAHVQMAMQVYHRLAPMAAKQKRKLEVSLLPTARSPFKQQSTAPNHRLAMLKLAVKDTPLKISELELWQTPPVYTIDSVRTLRQCHAKDSLIFIMGMDSACHLATWKDGHQLLAYVHLWLFARPSMLTLAQNLPSALQTRVTPLPTKLLTLIPSALKNSDKGYIYIDPSPITAVSSTVIRSRFSQQHSETKLRDVMHERSKDLSALVYQYIIAHQLYSVV